MVAKAKEKPSKTYRLKRRDYTDCVVYYFLLDANNKIVETSGYGGGYGTHSACFSKLFQGVNERVVAVYVYHPTNKMAYDEDAITRYISDISEMGFKCEYLGPWGEHSIFRIKLEDMETKNQFCSTLTLIRCLYENNSTPIPDHYLQAIDEDPKADKFLALQKAHKAPGLHIGLGHNVTSKDNGAGEVTLPILFKRFAAEKKTPFSSGYTTLNECWAGGDQMYEELKERKKVYGY